MKAAIFFFGFLCAAASASAQEDSISGSLQEVVVSAQRTRVALLKTPYQAAKRNAKYISEYQPRTTPEALMGLNGVFVQKTSHGGGSPFVRGLTGNQVLILVDGVRMNNSTFRYGPNQYLNTIDAYSISHIEVARGTGSVQYGSDAIGGVIQVFSKAPEFSVDGHRWKESMTGKFMSGGMEMTGHGAVAYEGEKLAGGLGLTFRNFGDLIAGGHTGKQSPSAYDEYAWDAKLKIRLGDHARLTLASQQLQQNQVPVYHRIVLENYRINQIDPQRRFLNYARYEMESGRNLARQISVIASWQQTTEGRQSSKQNSNLLRKECDVVGTAGLTLDIFSEFGKGWTANSGIEMYLDRISSKRQDLNLDTGSGRKIRGLYPDGARYGNYSVFTMHHFSRGKISAELGARANLFSIRLRDTTIGQLMIRPFAVVGNAALLYHLSDRRKVFVSLSNGYRAPNIDDMGSLGVVDFRYELPARNLRPEKSLNTELGYKYLHEKLEGTASLYALHLKDLITRVRVEGDSINGYPVYKKENTERAIIYGLEAAMKYTPFKGLSLMANMALQRGDNLTRQEPVRRIPPAFGRVAIAYVKRRGHASLEGFWAARQDRLAQGDKEDNRIPKGGTPGWTIVNAYAGTGWKFLNLNLGVQNIFNRDYRLHGSGIQGVGRSVWVSVEINFNQ